MRVGIYTRISSDDSSDLRGLGVKRQEQACREFAGEHGWEIGDVYEDNNISASSRADVFRPEYDRMLIDLACGRIDRILVLGQDRLLRRPEQLETLFRIHRNLDIPTIECVTGPQIDMITSTGRIHGVTLPYPKRTTSSMRMDTRPRSPRTTRTTSEFLPRGGMKSISVTAPRSVSKRVSRMRVLLR